MKLYNELGYADMRKIIELDCPFIFVIGGRGTGKTYGALKYIVESKINFMFMRRTQSQIDMLNKPEFSPFKPLMMDNENLHIGLTSLSKYNAGFYNQTVSEDGTLKNVGAPIGYSCALSTISNLRGFDASDCKILLYDEFISEKHERPINHEGEALLNAYETINRNRELKGEQPLKLVAMTNANDLNCPIFSVLGLIDVVDKMCRKNQDLYINKDKGIAIVFLHNSPISDAKRKTALYKITENTDFSKMALDNSFSNEDYSNVAVRPIDEYKPIVSIDDVCIYKHKSKREYYATRHISGNPEKFTLSELDIAQFNRKYGKLYFEILSGRMYFSDYYSKLKIVNAF